MYVYPLSNALLSNIKSLKLIMTSSATLWWDVLIAAPMLNVQITGLTVSDFTYSHAYDFFTNH